MSHGEGLKGLAPVLVELRLRDLQRNEKALRPLRCRLMRLRVSYLDGELGESR